MNIYIYIYISKLIKCVVSILFTEINLISNKLSKYLTNDNKQKLFLQIYQF